MKLPTAFAAMLLTFGFHAQNLVPNPGFEEIKPCAEIVEGQFLKDLRSRPRLLKLECLSGWYRANSSPDFFNYSYEPKKDYQPTPRSGNAYVGVFVAHTGSSAVLDELVEVKLKAPLKAGVRYYAEMYVIQHFSRSEHPFHSLGMKFRDEPLSEYFKDESGNLLMKSKEALNERKKKVRALSAQVINPEHRMLDTRDGRWMKVSGEFVARGGEQYLSIGGFRFQKGQDMGIYSYYYIDDIAVFVSKNQAPEPLPDHLEAGSSVRLNNVYFASGSSKLKPESIRELQQLVKLIQKTPEIRLEISGHTDNVGDEPANLALSEARAKAVYDYLITQGIDPISLKYMGMGESQPAARNDTKEGRARNRRIEVRIP